MWWWRRERQTTDSSRQAGGRVALAASSHAPRVTYEVAKSAGLPGEGTIYDQIGISNFVDLEKNKLTASVTKSIRSNALSNLLDADLPMKLTLGGKLGHAWLDGVEYSPVGKLGLTIQLLDLGGSDTRQGGFLRFKANTRTNGRTDHGFEIDRKVALFNLRHTTLYGNVSYRTSNRTRGVWKTVSSFGVHQAFKVAGVKCAARVGMTPEGEFVYDLRL
jgi:hypothetical protein